MRVSIKADLRLAKTKRQLWKYGYSHLVQSTFSKNLRSLLKTLCFSEGAGRSIILVESINILHKKIHQLWSLFCFKVNSQSVFEPLFEVHHLILVHS